MPRRFDETTPCTPGASPGATMVAMLHGEIDPGWKSAPFRKLTAVSCGPGGTTVNEKVVLKLPTDAVTVAAPVPLPARAVTCARPFASVVALNAESVAGPFTAN